MSGPNVDAWLRSASWYDAGDRTVDLDAVGRLALRWLFGDRLGVAVFLGASLYFAVTWRVGIFSTDTYAVANTMASVLHGHLTVTQVVYGPSSGVTPGMHVVGGRLYGRDYGMIVAALPLGWLLSGLSLLVDLRIAMAGAWCLGLLAFAWVVGAHLGARRPATLVGAAAAIGLFVGDVAVATPLPPHWYPVVALQGVTLLASAMTAVLLYRLLSRLYSPRVGWTAAATAALASPVAFWSTFPKRHAVTALFAVAALYTLYRSRATPGGRSARRFRALAYGCVGLTAWVHAAEGLVLLLAILAVDLPTTRSRDLRDHGVVALALLLSLVPFFLTNVAISGQPLVPPRLLTTYRHAGQHGGVSTGHVTSGGGVSATATSGGSGPAGGSASGGGGGAAGAGGGSSTAGGGLSRWLTLPAALAQIAASLFLVAWHRFDLLVGYMAKSVAPLQNVDRLWHVFVRSGYLSGLPAANDRAINLSVLESMPLLGGMASVPAIAVRRYATWRTPDGGEDRSVLASLARQRRVRDPARVADAFVVVYLGLLLLLYLSRIPTQFMLTVRYLHPIYPLGIYGLARLPPIRRAVETDGRRIAIGYAATVVVGIPLYVGTLAAIGAVESEAVQLFAVGAVTIGVCVGAWTIAAVVGGERYRRLGAPLLGIGAGAVTVYLLVSGLGVLAYTHDFALPLSRIVAQRLLPINPLRSLFRAGL